VIWEWLAILTSIVWLLAQSILLGRTDSTRLQCLFISAAGWSE